MLKRVSLVINNDDDGESSSYSSSLSFWKSLVERYKDESKPDPLVFKQMLTWSFQWIEDEDSLEEEEVPTTAATAGSLSQDNENNDNNENNDSFVLSGRLVWKGEHMQVTLHSTCRWKESSLEFVCRASASFCHDRNEEGEDNKEEKQKKNKKSKISKLMQQRLQQDDYISKLLLPDNGSDQKSRSKGKTSKTATATSTATATASPSKTTTTTTTDAANATTVPPLLLCQASILRNGQEERFLTQEDVAEGIRRAVWSASTDTLDVMEWILQYLPLLPTETKTTNNTNLTLRIYNNQNNNTATGTGRKEKVALPSLLAERAQLRLLEDAMYDACDKEGEVEIVETLKISDPTSNKKIKK